MSGIAISSFLRAWSSPTWQGATSFCLGIKIRSKEVVCCVSRRNNVLRGLTVTSKQRGSVDEGDVSTMLVGTALIVGSGGLVFPGNVFLKWEQWRIYHPHSISNWLRGKKWKQEAGKVIETPLHLRQHISSWVIRNDTLRMKCCCKLLYSLFINTNKHGGNIFMLCTGTTIKILILFWLANLHKWHKISICQHS
jgi:hypothetical protein